MTNVNQVPAGFTTITPYLLVSDGAAAIEFYKRAFNAAELDRASEPGGRLVNATLEIGNALLMLGETKDVDPRGEKTLPRVSMYLYVEDVDALSQQAVSAGAKTIMPVSDQFYGDRAGGFEDPFGIVWWIATHIEDVSPEEIVRRSAARRSQDT
jgi:PhnB protein